MKSNGILNKVRRLKSCESGLHKFEPRYDVEYNTINDVFSGSEITITNGAVNDIISKPKSKIYIHDICTRCGKVVCREKEDIIKDSSIYRAGLIGN